MPYSDDEEHSPSEFYYPDEISDETNDPNGRLEGENAEQNNNKNSQEKIEEFIHNQKAKTTITITKSDMKVFQRNFFLWSIFINCFVVIQQLSKRTARNRQYIRLKAVLAAKRFSVFF
jgi:phosphatidate phosphatase APP1